jgi:hypothetical protein
MMVSGLVEAAAQPVLKAVCRRIIQSRQMGEIGMI